jgi:hypothetical protein
MRFVCLCFWILLLPSYVQAQEGKTAADYRRIAALFFPETASWTKVGSMQHVDEKWLDANLAQLKRVFSAKTHLMDCSLASMLDWVTPKEYATFYLHDVNADGRPDVVFCGYSLEQESPATVIWFATATGYDADLLYFWGMLLSVKEGANLKLAAVKYGCCGEEIDTYSLRGSGKPAFRNIISSITFPKRESAKIGFLTKEELVLRMSPLINDTYDDFSTTANHAIFGNILSMYLPGCRGVVAGNSPDSAPGWSFVILSDGCRPLRTHLPYDVDAGWVETRQLNLEK